METYHPQLDDAHAPQTVSSFEWEPRPTPIVPAAVASAVGVLNATTDRKADVGAWDSGSQELFSILLFGTTGAANFALLKYEPRDGEMATVKQHGTISRKRSTTQPDSAGIS